MNQITEKEFGLTDIVKIIKKRKIIILTVFLVSVIFTLVIDFITPKTYVSSSLIQNGYIGEEALTNVNTVNYMFTSRDFLKPLIKELDLRIKPEKLTKSIDLIELKDTDLVKIRVKFTEKREAVVLCSILTEEYLNLSKTVYEQRLKIMNGRLSEIEERSKTVNQEINNTNSIIRNFSQVEKDQVAASTSIILLENALPDYESTAISLLNQKSELQIMLSKAKEPKIIDHPSEPFVQNIDKKSNIIFSAVAGLLVGLLLAFFIEYWGKLKKEI